MGDLKLRSLQRVVKRWCDLGIFAKFLMEGFLINIPAEKASNR